MSAGTVYNTKQELLDAIIELVYYNTNNETSSNNIQTAINNVVESIWGNKSIPQTSKIAWVDNTYGTTSGALGVESKPFATIQQANAVSPTLVIINPSPTAYDGEECFQDNISYHYFIGTTISSSSTTKAFNKAGWTGNLFGKGNLSKTGSFSMFNTLADNIIEFNSISTIGASLTPVTSVGRGVFKGNGANSVNYGKGIISLAGAGNIIKVIASAAFNITFENCFISSSYVGTDIMFDLANVGSTRLLRFIDCFIANGFVGSGAAAFSILGANNNLIFTNVKHRDTSGSASSILGDGNVYYDNNSFVNKAPSGSLVIKTGTLTTDTDLIF